MPLPAIMYLYKDALVGFNVISNMPLFASMCLYDALVAAMCFERCHLFV